VERAGNNVANGCCYGQGCRTIETAASPNPVGGNLIISVQKHGKAVSVGTVPDGSYYHSIVNSFTR